MPMKLQPKQKKIVANPSNEMNKNNIFCTLTVETPYNEHTIST